MKTQLLFVYPDIQWQTLYWLMIEQGERMPLQTGTLEDCQTWLAEYASSDPQLVVILPVEIALHTVVPVPRKQRRFLSRSLPFILEAQTAQDIDELHIVAGDTLPNDQVGVLAIPHQIMVRIGELARALNLTLRSALVDSQLLPNEKGQSLSLAWQGNRVLINAGGRGLACQRKDVMFWLERAWPEPLPSEGGKPPATALMVPQEHRDEAATLHAELLQQVDNVPPAQTVASGWLPMLADLWLQSPLRHNITVLTGPYEQKAPFTTWRPFVPAVALAASLLVVSGLLFFWQDMQRTEARASANWSAVEEVFLQATPSGFSFDPRQFRQVAENLLNRTGPDDQSHFMTTLSRLNVAFDERSIVLEELRYTGDRQEMQLQVTAASTNELEALRSALGDAAFTVTYSAGRVESGFRGIYRLQPNGEGA
ncbi:MAG: type II secretion system protein GspL [Natronospirillum sp.]